MLLFSLIIDLCLWIPRVPAQSFNLTAELIVRIGIRTEEVKAKIETHPVTAKAKKNNCSI